MSAKRGASDELNQLNYGRNDDEDDQDPGQGIKLASNKVLQTRAIKTPRKKGISSAKRSANPFAALANLTTPVALTALGTTASTPLNATDSSINTTHKDLEFFKNLKGLNMSFLEHASSIINLEPFQDLEFLFKEYDKHRADITRKFESVIKRLKIGAYIDSKQDHHPVVSSWSSIGFEQSPSGWSCTSCLVKNTNTCNVCISCKAKRPSATDAENSLLPKQDKSPTKSQPSPMAFDWAAAGMKKQNTWSCTTCLSNNNPEAQKCASCESDRPNLIASQSQAMPAHTQSNISAASVPSVQQKSSLRQESISEKDIVPQAHEFSFGNSTFDSLKENNALALPLSSAFTTKPDSTIFSFGKSTETKSFGSNGTASFSFGEAPAKNPIDQSPPSAFAAPQSVAFGATPGKNLSEIIAPSIFPSQSFAFGKEPIEIPIDKGTSSVFASPPSFSFGKALDKYPIPSAQKHLPFNADINEKSVNETRIFATATPATSNIGANSVFSFGNSTFGSIPGSAFTKDTGADIDTKSQFSNSAADLVSGSAEDGADDIVQENQIDPNALMVGEGEENEDITHSEKLVKVKMQAEDGSWEDQGIGELKIKSDKGSKKARLLVRTDMTGRIILNCSIFPQMKLIKHSDKRLQFNAFPGPTSKDSKPEIKMRSFILDIAKNPVANAQELINQIEKCK